MAKNSVPIHRRNFMVHLQERQEFDRPVLLKESDQKEPTSKQIAELHNEYVITRQLSEISGVRPVYAKEGSESHPVLFLEYIQGQSLSEIIHTQSLDLLQKLQLAVEIVEILGCIHDQGVMHRNICSSNILVSEDAVPGGHGGVYIIDFGLATTMRQEELTTPAAADADSLAYISPEQTGRMNRRVDYRTDLYSLGIILYELFTGQLPFESSDVLEMIHSHIARQPKPPQQIEEGIPAPMSEVILKLLAKNAEDRYQTAHGLQADLKRCLDQWQSRGQIEPFELGGDDYTGRLQIPQKLYGRQAEIEQLQTILDRAITEKAQLLLVAGYAGVGKTSLVHEMQKDVIAKQAIFIEGKFDQLQRTLPYSAWAQAFTQLVDNLLAENETSLAVWRVTILDALGDSGQILIDIIPALESIIGPQPEVPQLGGIENQNRFNYIFNRFISSLATPEHPLVVFLDDLQWIDPASLNLIEAILAVQETSCIMVIGAYRSNEVNPAHPLSISQKEMQAESDRVTVIELEDLPSDDTNHLLADSLQLSVADCRDLDKVLVEKSGGNPFFYRQLLYALEADKLLKFDVDQRHWRWDEALALSLQARGSVVDLMIEKIRTLPGETQRVLSLAACIGSRFDTSTLDIITGQEKADVLSDLNPAIQEGLIIRSDGHFSFAHDRIQEAGYALIPQSNLPQTHLEIGRTLLGDTSAEDLEEEIFAIVGHLNVGRGFIDRDSEKIELARLNLKAGDKAKAVSAYSDAKKYIEIGLELIGPDSWQDLYELTLSLHNENGELAYLTGRFDQLAPTVDLIQRNARSIYDQMRIYMTQIEAETAQYNVVEALDMGLEVLRDLGFEIPTQPTAEDIQRLNDKFIGLLTSNPMEQIARLPQMSDERALAASSLFASIMSTSYIINPPLFPIISYNGAILTLEYGLDVWAPFFFGGVTLVNFASVEGETPVDEELNLIRFYKQLVDVIRELLDNPVTARSRSKGLMMLAFTMPWIEPIEQSIEIAQATFSSGYETGDWLYASYGTIFYSVLGFDAGMNLDTYESQLSAYINNVHRMGYITPAHYSSVFHQTAQNFKEISPEPHRLLGAFFNEDEWLPGAITTNDINGRHYFYIGKLILVYHFDVEEKLDEYAGNAEDFLTGGQGMYSTTLNYLYLALAGLRLIGRSSSKKDPEIMNLIDQSLRWMSIWSETAPSTFQHKSDLIAAEKARVAGDIENALSHYEQAISGAREHSFTHEEALANELYARFWLERGNDRFASLFMREAHSLYLKWGALAKAEHLTNRYPNLIGQSIVVDEPHSEILFGQMTGDLDLLTIHKTSQAIASEIEFDRLLDILMTSAIENSGAQQGFLLLQEGNKWVIAAQADLDKSVSQPENSVPIGGSDLLSDGIVHYVARTQRSVLLDDASQSGGFVDDPFVQRLKVKSLLCIPLVNQGKTSAILYLENNLSPGTFTPERVELLELLSSQMAISIDNARTHDQLEKLLEERSKALRSAEEQIRAIFENSPLGIALSSYAGKFLTVNQALLDMLRISEEEALQRNVSDFYADPGDPAALLAEVKESGTVQDFGVHLIRNDGSSFFASLNINQLVLEGNEVLLALVEDVTDELAAEQETAALTEREHLARELHDAVSQTLFTAGMIAEATPRLWDKDPTTGQQNLEMLSVMIRGASAEMRSLLLELRPDTLKDQTLGNLLETLVAATRARTRAAVSLKVESDCLLPDDVTLTLHRIAQESLNNIAKHAEASEVVIDLSCSPESAKLSIEDDGRGFDPQAIPAGHLGIGIMRERAQKIGATLQINSKPGDGTSVLVTWSEARGGG
ncbi:MAG: AAA family ATPase [Chloroflexi bacterium]|nr:AAA family ATPase [Chloroflexota bacterium]